ncbi:hypothetical protein B0H12DRAFT_1017937 [Mycena haematopus]|nr:hypothetical protein B0H12DRAFT_1017937 [Mycena haematopus]
MSSLVANAGSTARDFCMLERNLLSHLKLALLLSLLSSSVLLRARLVPVADNPTTPSTAIAVASLQFTAALATIGAGVWEYYCGYRDLRNMHAFLVAVKPHLGIMSLVSAVVFLTCIIVLTEG